MFPINSPIVLPVFLSGARINRADIMTKFNFVEDDFGPYKLRAMIIIPLSITYFNNDFILSFINNKSIGIYEQR